MRKSGRREDEKSGKRAKAVTSREGWKNGRVEETESRFGEGSLSPSLITQLIAPTVLVACRREFRFPTVGLGIRKRLVGSAHPTES